MLQRGSADCIVVLLRQLSERRVDQQLNLPREQQIDRVGSAFIHLEHSLGWDATGPEIPGGAVGSENPKPERVEAPGDWNHRGFVVIVYGYEDRTLQREGAVGRDLRLGKSHPERVG